MRSVLLAFVLLIAYQSSFGEVVVLTETPVAEFTLPDGKVLKNAYVWRRNSQGLMIMHDEGNYFLNFKLLPDEWKKAYQGEPEVASESSATTNKTDVAVLYDRYKAASILEKVPHLDATSRQVLLSEEGSKKWSEQILMLGLLQNVLLDHREEAKRFLLILEEGEYDLAPVTRETLYSPCRKCAGDGHLNKRCKSCSGSGECHRCDGQGIRKAEIGADEVHCTTCRGKGDCAKCKGAGEFTPTCTQCKGLGKVVSQQYCEIKRNQMVRTVNAAVLPGKYRSVTQSGASGMGELLADWTALKELAKTYYLSEDYDGSMDASILAGCLLYSVLNEQMNDAAYYDIMIRVLYPDGYALEVEKYLRSCTKCEATGLYERDCRRCKGDGKCERCNGLGKRKLEIGDDELHCTTCRGYGKCNACGGDGRLQSVCQTCEGRGRILEQQRAEIKLDLLADKLNAYFDAR